MSAFFSSIKNMVDNYGQGIVSIQAQFEDMKFGLMPSSSQSTVAISIINTFYSSPTTARKNSYNNNNNNNHNNNHNNNNNNNNGIKINNNNNINMSIIQLNATSDFNQWLHAMKMVAGLPGGTPPEFRRKLWLALADRHLHTSGIDWNKEQAKCLSEGTWLDDDEELGIQIVKDLHRTGSSLFSGPNGTINQAKLQSVLLGYARWNPSVGYCQGFNMLGALILQVMERSEIESLKVMIYLIEGVLPKGYFSGSMGGLQADMAVFREILSTRLPKLSKHLQRLQGTTGENSMEPPIINVFTMQWFLTIFCTCLPKSCVLRVWDLILIEGSDILLRTALAIWASIADRIMTIKSADEFYCKMGTLSGELLNGHLFDSNGLIQRIVELGPIADLQKMREKHLFNVTPWKDRKGLKIFYSDDDVDSDDESWKVSGVRKMPSNRNQPIDTRERIAIDISLLKKQYAKLRERQRQANIINAAKQQPPNLAIGNTKPSNINQYLIGRNAIVSKGKRGGPPAGAIPPARITLPMSISNKYQQKRMRNATIDNATTSIHKLGNDDNSNIPKKANTFPRRRSESSSYSEDSDKDSDDDEYGNPVIALDTSSSSTSLCDDEVGNGSSFEQSPMKCGINSASSDECSAAKDLIDVINVIDVESAKSTYHRFNDDPDYDVVDSLSQRSVCHKNSEKNEPNIQIEMAGNVDIENNDISSNIKMDDKKSDLNLLTLPNRDRITSTSQLSPITDISHFLASSTISPLKTPTASYLLNSYPLCEVSEENPDEVDGDIEPNLFEVSDEGVTNVYFERVNHVSAEQKLEMDYEKELLKNVDSNDGTLDTSSTSNKNTDRILKMIEENSKILDRIMSKNAQSSDSQIQLKASDDISEKIEKCDSLQAAEAKIYKTEEIISDIIEHDDNEKRPECSMKDNDVHECDRRLSISKICDTVSHVDAKPVAAEKVDLKSLLADGKGAGDEIIFKYGDLSECISKYLDSPTERYERNEIEKKLIQKSETEKSNDFILPTSLALLTHDDSNTENMNNLLKQSFLEYSKSPSASLSIDSKIENDLETLLKMSAELLRDEFPISLANIEPLALEAKEDHALQAMSTANNSIDLMSTTVSEMDSTEATESKRNSSYYDADTLHSEMESVAGDISATISSIKNTIKSIDSLCQDDSRRSRDRTDKTLDNIIKVVERLEEEKEIRSQSQESRSSDHSRAPPIAMSMYEHSSRDDTESDGNLLNPRYSVGLRISRDRRRRKDDDFGEYESRARRTKSPSSVPMNRFSGDFSTEFTIENRRPSLIGAEHQNSVNSGSGTISKTASPYKSMDKFEIRHTTVTSTFYDRFLSQKYEEKHKMDRSPSSPIINKAYLNTLKPTVNLTQSYLTSDTDYKRKRASRSNETSPANLSSDATRSDVLRFTSTAPKSSYLLLPQLSTSGSIHRSCDNILSNLSSTSGSTEFVQKYSLQPIKKTYDLHMASNSSRSNIDTDEILRKHSCVAFNQSSSLTSALPIKPKKPSELGIKLGLYKP